MTVSAIPAAPFRFSTDDTPARDRMAIAREVAGRIYLRLDVEPLGTAPLSVSVEQYSWASLSLIFCDTNPLHLTRTPELVQDADGDFRFIVGVDGARYRYHSSGVDEAMEGSEGALLFNGVAGRVSLLERCRCTAVRIRRERLAGVVRRLDDRPIHRTAATLPLQLLRGYIELLRKERPPSDPLLAHRVTTHLIDLVALALGANEETHARASTGATRAARLATIRAYVLANLSDPNLSARTVARRHGVTDRYIHVLFEQTGQTFSRFVEQERLNLAYALLNDPERGTQRISDIAASAGFHELSTFDRAFRRRFGDTPSGVRRRRW
ncbi:AraC family transcriptional regulator [Bradyrhizobium sp. NP1]|uniref:helix-turn-helix transcriptional regulator n=1 Tax=Bradyrhizobium sp. NP1 TaxID=3049772 RepID=UPI0025A631E6|nr:AraC family transcriptional regulator [Bradyrhizobium sp. NP1]WJR77845.1 AraC family transcriptional regulator [Bradyrhizobium sp. NP1]